MKVYKCAKSFVKWKEFPQLNFNWKLPILIDDDMNVVLGNSLKDALPDQIFVIKMDTNRRQVLFDALAEIETRLVEENSEIRITQLQDTLRDYILNSRKKNYQSEPLFQFKETECITPENYVEPPPYNFNKHSSKADLLINGGNLLSEEFYQMFAGEEKSDEPAIEIDLEIMKELL